MENLDFMPLMAATIADLDEGGLAKVGEQPGTSGGAAWPPERSAQSAQPGLTVGRIVHFVMLGGAHRPAIVVATGSWDERSNLQVFTDGPNDDHSDGTLWASDVRHDDSGLLPNTWHWPERE